LNKQQLKALSTALFSFHSGMMSGHNVLTKSCKKHRVDVILQDLKVYDYNYVG